MSEEAVDDAVPMEIVRHRHVCPFKGCVKTFRCQNIGCSDWPERVCADCWKTKFLKRDAASDKE